MSAARVIGWIVGTVAFVGALLMIVGWLLKSTAAPVVTPLWILPVVGAQHVAFDRTSGLLAVSTKQSLLVWDVVKRREVRRFKMAEKPSAPRFMRDGQSVLVCVGGHVRRCKLNGAEDNLPIPGGELALSQDDYLAVGTLAAADGNRVLIYSIGKTR